MALQASTKIITPPGSIVNGPLTPPLTDTKPAAPVAEILQVFRNCQNGVPPRSLWTVYKLSSQEYEELLDQLQQDELLRGFVEDKVRYDYDPIQSILIIRMSTTLHDTFISKVVKEIEKALERLADAEIKARPFIEGIESLSGAMIFPLGDDNQQQTGKHVPDARFQRKGAVWPGVIIEVSYSQKRKSLPDLADNYILGSYGGVAVVVGLDLNYKKSKQASISMWRLKKSTKDDGEVVGKVEQVVENQLFRDAEGNRILSSSSSLKLSLKDFAIEEQTTHGVPDSSIVIDSETLCRILGEAEDWHKISMTAPVAGTRRFKREWRSKTTPEQLTFSDEEKLVEEERRVKRKLEKLDKPYGEEGVSAENSS